MPHPFDTCTSHRLSQCWVHKSVLPVDAVRSVTRVTFKLLCIGMSHMYDTGMIWPFWSPEITIRGQSALGDWFPGKLWTGWSSLANTIGTCGRWFGVTKWCLRDVQSWMISSCYGKPEGQKAGRAWFNLCRLLSILYWHLRQDQIISQYIIINKFCLRKTISLQ